MYLEGLEEATVPIPDFIEINVSTVCTIYRANSFSFVVDSSFEVVRRSLIDKSYTFS